MTTSSGRLQLKLYNLRLAKTAKGNIIIVIAYDFLENKPIVGKFDMKASKLTLGRVPMSYLYIYSLDKIKTLINEEQDPNGDNCGGLNYLMKVGIQFEDSWGLFDWTKMTSLNINDNKDDIQTGNYQQVEVWKPKHLIKN